MRKILLAAVAVLALAGPLRAELGYNVQTFERCAAWYYIWASEREHSGDLEGAEASLKVAGAFGIMAVAERSVMDADVAETQRQIEQQTRWLQERMKDNYSITGQGWREDVQLVELYQACSAMIPGILEAIEKRLAQEVD